MFRSGKLIASLFVVASALILPVQAQEKALDAKERAALLAELDAIKQKAPSIQAKFTERRQSRLVKKPLESKGTISFDVPNKFRRDVGGTNPSLTVSDGKVLWLYYPNFKEAELYTLGHRAMFDDAMAALTAGLNFSRVEEFYHLHAVRQPDGGHQITLTPKRSNLKRIVTRLVVSFDAKYNVTRTALTMPKGDEVITDYFEMKRTQLPASTFDFTPPEGTNISRPLGK